MNELTTTQSSVEVLPPLSETTSTLIQRAKTFHKGIGTHLRSAAGYSLLLGQALISLKASVPHGQFEALREVELPDVPRRTAQYYMALAEKLKRKSATIAHLLEQPELLTTPEIAEEHRQKLDKVVFNEFDGKLITEIAREEKVIRPPKKHHEVNHHPVKEKLSMVEQHAQAVDLARTDWGDLDKQLAGYGTRFSLLETIEIQAQISHLETLIRIRRRWLDAPRDQRNEALLKQLSAELF